MLEQCIEHVWDVGGQRVLGSQALWHEVSKSRMNIMAVQEMRFLPQILVADGEEVPRDLLELLPAQTFEGLCVWGVEKRGRVERYLLLAHGSESSATRAVSPMPRSCILRRMSDRALSGPRGWRGSKWSWLLGALALLVVVLIARPVLHLLSIALDDQDNREALEVGHVDDASGLNATRVAEVWAIPTDAGRAEEQLRLLLRRAKQQGLAISIAGARHTMGGHTITPDGVVVDMLPFNAMHLGESEGTLWVQAGARWSEVIPFLDRHDLSVAVMQSNNSFSVGGSLGANCHGWQHGRPPICDTVQSFRLMKADGSIVTCSRSQNRELFSLA
ncbi:MAG TPA: FAD-binding oxidoreductase, partial [Planctomycetes bacterium]|nr:FAD-binding oxidoreductase [Planctomycetota bacterium]